MTTSRHDDAHLVRDWLRQPADLPSVNVAELERRLDQTAQQRGRLLRLERRRYQSMFSATRFVLASIVLALFGGVLAAGLLNQSSPDPAPAALASASAEEITEAAASAEPDPTPEATPVATTYGSVITLAEDLPEGVESGTIQTPAGLARWVHMTSGAPTPDDMSVERTAPAVRALVPWDGGIAAVGAFGLWTTSDGVHWEPVPLPVEDLNPFHRRVLRRIDDTYVLVLAEPFGIWTAKELDGDWHELDISAIKANAPGAGWQGGGARLAVEPVGLDDGRIGFSMSREYRMPRQALGLPLAETKRMKRLGGRRYALCGNAKCSEGGTKAKWIVRFTETDGGLKVVNNKTGKQLGRIDGARLSELYEGATGVQIDSFAIDGDTVVSIDHPWPALDHIDTERPPWLGRIVVFAPDSSTALFSSWDSRGTLRPGDPGVASIARTVPKSQGEFTSLSVTEHLDRLTARMWVDAIYPTGGVLGNWESTDGLTWSASPSGLPQDADVSHTGSAWWAEGMNKKGNPNGKHWMHLGGEWVSVDELGGSTEFDPVQATGLGNVTVFTGDYLGEAFDVWVLTHPVSE